MTPAEKARGVSAAALKRIAAVTMLIDHVTHMLFLKWYFPAHGVRADTRLLYYILRGVGRPAFPIYCFLLVEGYYRTRSRSRYLLRLGVFGLLSEIPFDMALEKGLWDWTHQNVYFTLALGLAAIWAFDAATRGNAESCPLPRLLLGFGAAAAAGLAAHLLHTDYGWGGVLVIWLMYLFRAEPGQRFLTAGSALLTAGDIEAAGWAVFPLLDRYNGLRGRQRKYFHYFFYPGHLLLLALLRAALTGAR